MLSYGSACILFPNVHENEWRSEKWLLYDVLLCHLLQDIVCWIRHGSEAPATCLSHGHILALTFYLFGSNPYITELLTFQRTCDNAVRVQKTMSVTVMHFPHKCVPVNSDLFKHLL
jgi:hypothetical protein